MRDRLIIKAEARRLVQQGHVSPILATAVVLAVCFVLDRLVDLTEGGSLFATFQYDWAYLQAVSSGDLDSIQAVLDLAPQATVTSLALTIAVSLFTAVLSGGYCLFCLDILHRREAALSTLMDGLGSAGRLIWCNILIAVKIALWTMLGMVPVLVLGSLFFTPTGIVLASVLAAAPGIIAAYRYRFAIYNVLTDPGLSASRAIALSCEQTQGIKWTLFVLDLSFIGWSLLSALTLGLLDLWVMPYKTLCDLSYFEDARQRLGGGDWDGSQDWNQRQ